MSTAMTFGSDNHAGIVPEVLAAIAEANVGHASGYGDDPWTQQAEALPCASLSTSPPVSTLSVRSPLLLPAASGSGFSHQPVAKFSSPFWFCRDVEMPAQSSLGKGSAALVREAAADQVPLGAAYKSSLSQPPSATSCGFPVDVANGLFQSASTPSTLKKPVVTMADRKAAVLGKHQGHDFL